jgi:ABC-2 type transport system permease protein
MRSSVELTLAHLAVRQTTSSRRSLWALLLAALPVALSLLARAQTSNPQDALEAYTEGFGALIARVLLPLVALVVGTGVFGNEVDDGTITYVLGKPVPRWRIVLTRIVTAGALTAAVVAPATLLSGVVAYGGLDPQGIIVAGTLAMVAGSFLYCALFVALSLSTRRALVAGLAYVVVWEGSLSGFFAGTRVLSIRQYTLSFAEALSRSDEPVFGARLAIGTALAMSAAVAVLATVHAIRRLRGFEIGEAV